MKRVTRLALLTCAFIALSPGQLMAQAPPGTALASVTITNPQSNSTNNLNGGAFTFTGTYNAVSKIQVFLVQAGAPDINMGFAKLDSATHTWSLTFGPIAPNPAPAAPYAIQAIGNAGIAADVRQNVRFITP